MICLLRRVYTIGGNFPALTLSRDWPWMCLFGSHTRPRPPQLIPICHCIAKSRIHNSSWTGMILTRLGVLSERNLHTHSKHTHNVILLSTHGLVTYRQLVIPPGNQDNRFEKVVNTCAQLPCFQRWYMPLIVSLATPQSEILSEICVQCSCVQNTYYITLSLQVRETVQKVASIAAS